MTKWSQKETSERLKGLISDEPKISFCHEDSIEKRGTRCDSLYSDIYTSPEDEIKA